MSAINNTFYKGYIITENKRSIEKFKGRTDFKTLEQVQSLPEFAGVMAEDSILVDIDDMEQSNLLLDICDKEGIRCKVLQSRSGMHFLFKNSQIDKCYTKTKVACGLTFDIKSGFKSSYEVLKIDGKERTVLYDILEGEEYQDIPKWLFPIKCTTEFLDMDAGSGRNQALFNYILTLQAADFTIDEIKQCIRIMNTYILKEPLPESEIDVILRDEAFKKPVFFKGSTFLHENFAKYLISEHYIVKIDGKLHLYQDGVYSSEIILLYNAMRKCIPNIKKNQKSEVVDCLMDLSKNTEMAAPNMIAFRNGIYDLETDSLKPFSPNVVITNRIPWDYNPAAYSEIADRTLNKIACDDADIRLLLEECIGYCFYRSNVFRKAFILTGKGSNGKSTFISVLHKILGSENIAAMDLKNLGDRFAKASLFKKLANIGDDISDEFVPDPSLFKKIVSGDRIQAEFKGQDPFEFNPYVKLVFSANNIPRMKDKTGAVISRLVIIPFNAEFSEDSSDFDPDIKYKLQEQESIEYFIRIGIEGLKQILQNRRFTKSVKVQKELDEYEEYNNPVIGFFKEQEEGYLFRETTKDIYLKYSVYCSENGFQAESSNQFGRSVKSLFKVESVPRKINNKSVRFYKKLQ